MKKLRKLEFILFYIFLITIKYCISLFAISNYMALGSGNDADIYDAYAKGDIDAEPNIWPIFLRALATIGLYQRDYVSILLLVFSFSLIPLLSGIFVHDRRSESKTPTWMMVFFVSIYPTIFYYSLDLYRDTAMLLFFLVGLNLIKRYFSKTNALSRIATLAAISSISVILTLFRPYLGFSFVAALLLTPWTRLWRRNPLLFLLAYSFILSILFSLNLFDSLIEYRKLFLTGNVGGSTFRLDMTEWGAIGFPIKFFISLSYQLLGLYLGSPATLIFFILETLPFLAALVFLFRKRRHSSKIVDYLFIFTVIYSTIWLIGNDNFGTAVRLRIFSYISIVSAALIIRYEEVKEKRRLHPTG